MGRVALVDAAALDAQLADPGITARPANAQEVGQSLMGQQAPMAGGMPDDVKASLEAMVPFPARLGEPSEFADAVCFILQNRYMNGTTLRLDGAARMPAK